MSQYCSRLLPEAYVQELAEMTDYEIAAEAARFRSDSLCRKGSSTAAILFWYRIRSGREEYEAFLLIYSRYWTAEKAARRAKKRVRPSNRPIVGSWSPAATKRPSFSFA
ncbi:hypothetical protein HYU82_01505 [Candidatus Saccharibacteria bacterium]|nr:hypothetical protein [Candidatus Saccharibacteria bacterium]